MKRRLGAANLHGETALRKRQSTTLLVLVILGLVVACGGGGSGSDAGGFALSAPTTDVAEGFTLAISAQPGATPTDPLIWSSSDVRIASVDPSGRVLGCQPGPVTVAARGQVSGRRAEIGIRVVPDERFNTGLPENPAPLEPTVQRKCTIESCEITLGLEGIAATTKIANERRFHRLALPHAGDVGEEGRPEVPFYALYFAIPVDPKTQARAQWSVEVERTSPLTYDDIRPWPHQPPQWIDGKSEEGDRGSPFVQDEAFYASQAPWPAITHSAESIEVGNLPILEVRVIPVEYVPAAQRLSVFQQTRVRVTFERSGEGELAMPRVVGDYKGMKQNSADEIVAEVLQNSDLITYVDFRDLPSELPAPDILAHEDTPFDLLIVTRAELYPAAARLAQWRQENGTRVWLTTPGETHFPDAESIQAHIREMHEDNRLETASGYRPHAMRAVLLFGDVGHIPTFEGMNNRAVEKFSSKPEEGDPQTIYICGTDLPYSTLRGLDHVPDVALGRISVNNNEQGLDVVEKIERYESMPEGDYPDSMAFYSYFDDVPEHRAVLGGDVSFVNGVDTVTGTTTSFRRQVLDGDVVRVYTGLAANQGKWHARVAEVVNDTELRLEQPWTEPSISGSQLQVAHQDGQDNWEFVKSSERVRMFMRSIGVRDHFGYTRNADPAPAPVPTRGFAGLPLHPDLLTPYAWDCDSVDIQDRWRSGQDGIVLHSGHGDPQWWWQPKFEIEHVEEPLTDPLNTWYPIVLSINCSSGWFDAETDKIWVWDDALGRAVKEDCENMWPPHEECFCEAVLREPDGGGVAVVGASRGTGAGKNDKLIDGIFGAMYREYRRGIILIGPGERPVYEHLGDIVKSAKFTMRAWVASPTGGDSLGQANYNMEAYHLFGDPMLRVRPPRALPGAD